MEKEEFKQLQQSTEAALKKIAEDVKGYAERGSEEIKRVGAISAEVNGKLGELTSASVKLGSELAEIKGRVLEIEQKGVTRGQPERTESNGEMVVKSAEYAHMVKSGDFSRMSPVAVKGFGRKAAITTATAGSSLVVNDRVPGIYVEPERALRIRDLLPVISTSSNAIEFAKEVLGSNTDWQAAPQYSSPNHENVAKKELKVEFGLETEAVRTIAGWIPASRQILADASALAGYINTRLTHGVKLEEDEQLLNGSGTGGDLNGLITQATAYNEAVSGSGDTILDTLLRAIAQSAGYEYSPDGIVISKTDWYNMLLLKDQEGRYLFGDPSGTTVPRVWGLNTVATAAMADSGFLVGAFQQGATLFDREQATVRIAEQHSDFFVKNMVVVLGEERLALVVYSGRAFVKGNFES